ncbi:MAG: XylR family transcriptional regulator [Thermoguttaceae bacterium]|nr:XylR family transcriptional regulator [Thermoguttaceae bacterium]
MRPRKNKILLLIESSTSYGRDILQGISQYARERNMWYFSLEPRGITEQAPLLRSWKGQGIISRVSDEKTFRMIKKVGCPFVELLYESGIVLRTSDDDIIKMAMDHFRSLHVEHYGFFSYGGADWIQSRRLAFEKECTKRGITPFIFQHQLANNAKHVEPLWSVDYEKYLLKWLRTIPKPIAILAVNDHQAVQLMNYCRELSLFVPDSVAILGINNDSHLCSISSPTISSIDPNARHLGYEAAALLDKKMQGLDISDYPKLILPLGVITRESTETLNIDHPDIVQAVRFIRRYATQGIRVTDVLEEVQLSNKTLERWFKKTLGHTPEQEIIRVRIEYAVNLLKTTNMSVKMISELSGFNKEQYFVQVFRRIKGKTPGQFRKKCLTEKKEGIKLKGAN